MKFLVLLYTTFIVQCFAVKTSDGESHLKGVASPSGWAESVKRFYILLFFIPGVVLYYIPESRYYARKACHLIIDVVANGLKAALTISFGNEACADVGRTSYYSDRFTTDPEIQNSVIMANAPRDHLNPSHPRRRHRVKQDSSKIDEDKTRGHEKRKHRHGERPRYEKNRTAQHHQLQSTPKTTSKELEIRPSPSPPPPLHFYTERSTEGFYYPEVGNVDGGPKYSTSFVISGVKTTSNLPADELNDEKGSAVDPGEEEYPPMICEQRSRPSRRTRPEDAIHPENDGPTRDCESFISTELKNRSRSYDIESKIEFTNTTLDYPERECEVSSRRDQPHHEDSATTVQECDDAAEDWERGGGKRGTELEEGLPPAEGNFRGRIKEATFSARGKNLQKKSGEKCRRKISEDDENSPNTTKSEEVLVQLGEQIAKLEKTIRTMKPEVKRKERGQRNGDEYAVRNIEMVLKDMKRSFSKVDEQMKRRRRSGPRGEIFKERGKRSLQHREDLCSDDQAAIRGDAVSVSSVVDEDASKAEGSWPSLRPRRDETADEVPEEEISTNRQDLAIIRSEILLEDEEELGPILTNRVKPYLTRTFDWLFTGCPGASAPEKHGVGKDGASKTAAEWVP